MMELYDAKCVVKRWLGCQKHIKDVSYCARHPKCTGCKYEWKEKELEDAMSMMAKENVIEVTFCEDCCHSEPESVEGFQDGEYVYCGCSGATMHKHGFCSDGKKDGAL